MEDQYKIDAPEAVPSSGPTPTSENWREVARRATAEFVASALFIFSACGAAIATTRFNTPGNVTIEIALAFGFALVSLCFAIGHVSGGHLNCVVSFCFAMAGKITWTRAFAYFFAQWLGGMVGAAFLRLISPPSWKVDCLASNRVSDSITAGQAVVVEIILTFFLMLVVNAASDDTKSNQMMVPVAIGFSVSASHMFAIPLTGTSLNPTRSFASAAVSSTWAECTDVFNDHWVFWVGPMIGGILATLIYEFVFLERGASSTLEAQYRKDAKVQKFRDPLAEMVGVKKATGATFDDVQPIE